MTTRRRIFLLSASLFVVLGTVIVLFDLTGGDRIQLSPYPDGKNFAFTVTSDPDETRLRKIEPVYELLTELGFRTTIAVWVLEATRSNGVPDVAGDYDYGDTLQREHYRDYIKTLSERGFEIAIHTASGGNDPRENMELAYADFRSLFGYYPKIAIMHAENLDNVYWGNKVLNNRIGRWILSTFISKAGYPFSGDDPASEYYWGDLLKARTKYVRLWGTPHIDTLSFNPSMPYHDPNKPLVNYWFSFSDGSNGSTFGDLVSKENVDELVAKRGASIVYAHFANGFVKGGEVDQKIEQGLRYLATQKDGWFVTTSELLDRLLLMKAVYVYEQKGCTVITNLNQQSVPGVTLLLESNGTVFTEQGQDQRANQEGELIIGDLGPYSSKRVCRSSAYEARDTMYIGLGERIRMVRDRARLYLRHH